MMQSALALDIDKVIPGHRDLDMIRVLCLEKGLWPDVWLQGTLRH